MRGWYEEARGANGALFDLEGSLIHWRAEPTCGLLNVKGAL
jgi:hypothetical protein